LPILFTIYHKMPITKEYNVHERLNLWFISVFNLTDNIFGKLVSVKHFLHVHVHTYMYKISHKLAKDRQTDNIKSQLAG